MLLASKTAIVTGSTSGIGLGIARAFAAQGADVMLNGLGQADEIEYTRAELQRELGVRVRYHGADMSRPEQVRDLAAQAENAFGRVDVVVNNAGIQHVAPVEDFPQAKWDAVLAINLTAAFALIQAVVPGMKARRFGRILNVASAHGLTASPFKSAYVAAKHGLVGLTRCVAVELAEFGITANTLCPGYVRTPLVEQQIADQARKEFVRVEELAALAVFLASDAAASMTATAIPMDGGWTQH